MKKSESVIPTCLHEAASAKAGEGGIIMCQAAHPVQLRCFFAAANQHDKKILFLR
jgi:hypothetical protein